MKKSQATKPGTEIGIFLFFSSSGSRHSENLKRILGTLDAQNFPKFPKILKAFQSATGILWIVVSCKKKIISLMFVSFLFFFIYWWFFLFLLYLVSFLVLQSPIQTSSIEEATHMNEQTENFKNITDMSQNQLVKFINWLLNLGQKPIRKHISHVIWIG